jgi:SAM-dependent methyltransferase
MSEDTGAKRAGRRRRTTRAGRRSALRMPEGVVRESWPAVGSVANAEGDDEDLAAEEGLEEGADELDAADEASEGRCDTVEMASEGTPRAGELGAWGATDAAGVLTPLPPTPEEEKTLPRIRVDDYLGIVDAPPSPAPTSTATPARQRDSDADALTNPRIPIAGLGFNDAVVVGHPPSVVIAPSRIISDAPARPRPAPAPLDEAQTPAAQAPDDLMSVFGQTLNGFESLVDDEPIETEQAPIAPVERPVPVAVAAAAVAAVDAVQVEPAVSDLSQIADVELEESGLQLVDVEDLSGESPRERTPPPPPPQGARADAASLTPGRPKPPPPAAGRADAASAPPAARPKPPPPPSASRLDEDRQKRKQVRQWWERFFSDDYLMTVLAPSAAQIAKQVDFVESSLGLARGATVLDVGCGLGLHAIELARRGHLVVGLDLSLAMITRAAESAQEQGLKINFVHADIREMEFDGAFDAVICMGTTLGFFDEDANRDVLARLYQALRPGGRLLIDVVNRDYVVGFQPNLVWFEGDGCVCMEESDFNYFNSRLTVKRTMMREDGHQSNAEYSLRLYSLHELGGLMQQTGFRVIDVSGQEAVRGAFFGVQSPRILMLAERRMLGRPSAEMGRPSAAMSPERGSGEIQKPPKPE